MKTQSNRAPASFQKIAMAILIVTTLVLIVAMSRMLKFSPINDLIPDSALNLIMEENIYGLILNKAVVFSSALGALFLLLRKGFAYQFFLFSFAGMTFMMFHEFFVDEEFTFIEGVMMLVIFSSYTFFLYYAVLAKNMGWLSSLNDNRTTVLLRVQEGCDNSCPYCLVPINQGKSHSDTLDNVILNAKQIASNGVKEIVLSGPNIAGYGKGEFGNKDHEHTFFDLIKEVDKVGGVDRFRFSSISSPEMLSDEILEFISSSTRIAPHFNIRLQSGSVAVLKKMKRRHTLDSFTERISKIKSLMPHAYVSLDIIVGFPGETDELFLETYNYLKSQNVSEFYVWSYYDKPKTEGAAMKDKVLDTIKTNRRKILNELSQTKLADFYKTQLGRYRTVLFEKGNKKGYMYGYTENHVKVKAHYDSKLENTLQKVKLTNVDSDGSMLFDFVDKKLRTTMPI